MTSATRPSATVRQISGTHPDGHYILGVLFKRTYAIAADGTLREADEQLPLIDAPETDPENPRVLVADTDLYPHKLATDIVLKGHAYGRSHPQFDISVRVGDWAKRVSVIGNRSCAIGATGRLAFSAPGPVEKI